MPEELEIIVRRLADRAAISDVLARYLREIDRQHWDLVAACFTEDAVVNYGGRYAGQGREEQAAFFRTLSQAGRLLATTHILSNILIEINADDAVVESYTLSCHARGAPQTKPTEFALRGLRYMDTFRRTAGGWKIAHRTLAADWEVEAVPTFALRLDERVFS